MTRVDLPDEQWVELWDPRKVSERKRRLYLTAMSAFNKVAVRDHEGNLVPEAMGAEESTLLATAVDLATVALVKAWSFEFPVEVDSLQDLPIDAFDDLRRAVNEIARQLLPNFSPSPDPKATTAE